jgi:hypothetical protein
MHRFLIALVTAIGVAGVVVFNVVALQHTAEGQSRACEAHATPWMQVSAEYAECLRQQEQDASGE